MKTIPSTPARLEAFSDGVIAVIITIMVLELHVPHENGLAGLRAVLPVLLVYALSFTYTGIYWINHRHLIDHCGGRMDRVDESVLWANLFLLFCLSLLPFFTSYLLAKHLDSFSVALYGAGNLITGFGFLLLRLAILRRLRHSGTLVHQDLAARPKDMLSVLAYVVSIPLAFYHPYAALGLIAAVTVIWIVPNIGIKS
jgi:uncharacterized membrane protein